METVIESEQIVEESCAGWNCLPWGIGAVVLLLLLAFLIYKRRKYLKQKEKLKSDVSVDMDNLMASSFQAKALYDKLKVKCHPDRFLDEQKRAIATEIAQEMNENKYDYKKLCELKERAEKELNIKIIG